MKLIINGRDYPLPASPTYREMRIAKRASGLLPGQMYDGIGIHENGELVAIDPDAAVGFAALALAHDDPTLTWQQIEKQIDALENGTITFDLREDGDDDDLPPAEAAEAAVQDAPNDGEK